MSNAHEASAAALGYLYQARLALLLGLRAIVKQPELSIAIEKFDDISFQDKGLPIQLIQTKHHVSRIGNLTDSGTDLWKTLHIWIKNFKESNNLASSKKFILMTTGIANKDSAASFLKTEDRDEAKANEILLKVATSSENKKLADAYAAYINLLEPQRLQLLSSIQILDGADTILQVRDEISNELRLGMNRDHLEAFVDSLEGWWLKIVIEALSTETLSEIPVMYIDTYLDELRESFQRNSLPVDFEKISPTDEIISDLDKRPFVQQLRNINIGQLRIEYAIRDFYRASEQRSKWTREQLLVYGEIDSYDHELIEAWEPRFAGMADDLNASSSIAEKIECGKKLFKWAETEARFPLRTVTTRFLTHGSFHILANRLAIGWHPEFKDILVDREIEKNGE